MKTIIGAIALVVAAPAAAQAAGEQDTHAEHQQTSQEERAGHQGHEGHAEHKMDCCTDCCGERKQVGPKDCCAAYRENGEAEQDHSAHGH